MIRYECDKCSKTVQPSEVYGPGVPTVDTHGGNLTLGRPYMYKTENHSLAITIMPTSQYGEHFCGECVMLAVAEMLRRMWPDGGPIKELEDCGCFHLPRHNPDCEEYDGPEEGSSGTDPSDVLPDVRPGDELPDPSPDDNPEWRKESAEVLAALLGPCKSCGGAPFREPPDSCNDPSFHGLGRSPG